MKAGKEVSPLARGCTYSSFLSALDEGDVTLLLVCAHNRSSPNQGQHLKCAVDTFLMSRGGGLVQVVTGHLMVDVIAA